MIGDMDMLMDAVKAISKSVMRRLAAQRSSKSLCCNAPVAVGGEGSTHYYVCGSCGKPCDIKKVEEGS